MSDNITFFGKKITNHASFILDLGNPMSQNNLKTNNDTVMLRAMRNKKLIGLNVSSGEDTHKKMHSMKLVSSDKRQNKIEHPVGSSIKSVKTCATISKSTVSAGGVLSNQRY